VNAPTALGAAWRFLTRVPVGDARADGSVMHRAPGWFPVVGVIVGALAGAVHAAAEPLAGRTVAAALAVTAGALITGAFHHDGLADIADAYGGGWDVEQRLAILKDSRHGTYGVMALVCAVVVQVAALATCDGVQGAVLLVAAHCAARAGSVSLIRFAPKARDTGLGADAARRLPTRSLALALVTGTAVQAALLGVLAVWTIAAVVLAAGAVAVLSSRKIGGITGDALGAAEQVGETLVLVCGAVFVHNAWSWPWWR
jgi:adenosylcobinamide-GDP ribazoletransferase